MDDRDDNITSYCTRKTINKQTPLNENILACVYKIRHSILQIRIFHSDRRLSLLIKSQQKQQQHQQQAAARFYSTNPFAQCAKCISDLTVIQSDLVERERERESTHRNVKSLISQFDFPIPAYTGKSTK